MMKEPDSAEEAERPWRLAGNTEEATIRDLSSPLLPDSSQKACPSLISQEGPQEGMPEHHRHYFSAVSNEQPQRHLLSDGIRDPPQSAFQNYDLRQDRHHRHFSSSGKVFGNIIISVVGSGVLGLPYTFKRTGWLPSTLVLSVTGILCYYCMMLLVWSRKRVERDSDRHVNSFSDLAFLLYGKWGRFAVDFILVLSQGAFCVAYLIFIGENLASVFGSGDNAAMMEPYSSNVTQTTPGEMVVEDTSLADLFSTKEGYIWVIFPLEVALASIRTLTKLAPFSIFADVLNFGSMAVVMQQDAATMISNGIASISMNQGLSTVPLTVGVAIYAFEGIALVLPLESSMKEREKFGNVLGLAMAFITILYVMFGLLGYLAFGEETLDIVTLNLGVGWKTVVVKIGLCVGLFFTFGVMMFPVHQVVEQRLVRGTSSILLRATIVLLAALCATVVPHFGDFLSLVGNSVCCAISFVVPALFHMKASREDISGSMLGLDCIIIVFGIVYGFLGTVLALLDILSRV